MKKDLFPKNTVFNILPPKEIKQEYHKNDKLRFDIEILKTKVNLHNFTLSLLFIIDFLIGLLIMYVLIIK